MANRNFFKARKITLAQQVQRMKSLHPQFSFKWLNRKSIVWRGKIQPSPINREYLIEIKYIFGERPDVTVLNPKLELAKDKSKLPHVFSGDRLCLYYWRFGEWNAGKFIAETIVLWSCFWLFYYEVWLATGEWFGGGVEHESPN
jgi:hypothetical protein